MNTKQIILKILFNDLVTRNTQPCTIERLLKEIVPPPTAATLKTLLEELEQRGLVTGDSSTYSQPTSLVFLTPLWEQKIQTDVNVSLRNLFSKI